ncbi:MAG: 30S ribosomal protein S4 [Candidatus Liptonbacteria bacterium]|nr:30S ribosomal protein S4 [Candidatus Liptonbacteria bacterium]
MIGPKEKKERRLDEHLHLKGERCNSPKCAMIRKPYPPGAHGKKRQRKNLSEFALQLREKQKFKVSYGLDERGLGELYRKARKETGSTALKLLELFERRLDNVVFRLGLTPSRLMARQEVVHGHILVNQKRVRSPGLLLKVGDVVGIRGESKPKTAFRELKEKLKKYEPPSWLHLDVENLEGRVIDLPKDLKPAFEINLLIESFSK